MLWVKTLVTKCLHDPRCPHRLKNVSHIWSSLQKISPILESGLQWIIRNSRSANFWHDKITGLVSVHYEGLFKVSQLARRIAGLLNKFEIDRPNLALLLHRFNFLLLWLKLSEQTYHFSQAWGKIL